MKAWIIVASTLLLPAAAFGQNTYHWKYSVGVESHSQTAPHTALGAAAVYVDPLGPERILSVYDWYQQSKIFRDLDFAVFGFAMMRDQVALCPSDLRLNRLQHKVEDSFLRDRDDLGSGSLMKLMTDYAIEAGCHSKSSIYFTVEKRQRPSRPKPEDRSTSDDPEEGDTTALQKHFVPKSKSFRNG